MTLKTILNKSQKGFTLVELLVVIAMIAIIMAAMTTSVRAAQERARIQKATSDVKVLSQAILASENFARGGKYELQEMQDVDADASTLRDLLGKGAAESGGNIPALIMASLQSGGKMLDPWGRPYKIRVKKGSADVKITSASSSMQTGYVLPNFYRLSAEERQ